MVNVESKLYVLVNGKQNIIAGDDSFIETMITHAIRDKKFVIHREDGPAVIKENGTYLEYWLNNRNYTETKWKRVIEQEKWKLL
jgi:hypothetical protein